MVIQATNTTGSNIILTDLSGYTLLPSTPVDLGSIFNIYNVAQSNVLIANIANGNVTINNGSQNLDATDAIRYVSLLLELPLPVSIDSAIPLTASVSLTQFNDTYDRLKVSHPEIIYVGSFSYDELPYEWDTITAGGGSISHIDVADAVYMNVGTASGASVIRQTKFWYRFQQGYAAIVLFVAKFEPKANVMQRVGFFSTNAGLFFQHDGTTLAIVERSDSTGSVVDTVVSRSSWNIDVMDGTGTSGVNIDIAKTQQFVIEFQGLSGGRVRYGFNINGTIYFCHQSTHYNVTNEILNLYDAQPLRFEITNTGTTASASKLIQLKALLISDGPASIMSRPRGSFTASRGTSTRQVGTTIIPLLSLRAASTFKSKASHIIVAPTSVGVFSLDNAIQFFIYKNVTLTGASWTNVLTDISGSQYDITSTALSGGIALGTGFLADTVFKTSGTSTDDGGLFKNLYLSNNYAGTSDVFTIAAKSFGSTASVTAYVNFKEIY